MYLLRKKKLKWQQLSLNIFFFPKEKKLTFFQNPSEMLKRSKNAIGRALLEMTFVALQKILPMGPWDRPWSIWQGSIQKISQKRRDK